MFDCLAQQVLPYVVDIPAVADVQMALTETKRIGNVELLAGIPRMTPELA